MLADARDDVRGQRVLVGPPPRRLPLGRSMLSEHAMGDVLRDRELLIDMIDTGSATGETQKFCWRRPSVPGAAHLTMNFSSVRSETAFHDRSFFFSSAFSRFT